MRFRLNDQSGRHRGGLAMNRRRRVFRLFLVAIAVSIALLGPPKVAHGATFTVDSTADTSDSFTNGVCDDGAGNCTLRAAMEEAAATTTLVTIHFDIPGPGPHMIKPNDFGYAGVNVIIDGTTEPDFVGSPIVVLAHISHINPAGRAVISNRAT